MKKQPVNRIQFEDLYREILTDPVEIKMIVRNSHPDVQNKTGFYLFAEEFDKDPAYLEFGENSVWNPTYFVYRDIDDNIVAMRSFRIKDPILKGYAHMMCMQVLGEYAGNFLSKDITNDTISYIRKKYPNIVGVTLIPREPSLEGLYSRYGYEVCNEDGIRFMKRDFKANESSSATKTINILFPGGFKPVHSGHITLIRQYLDNNGEFIPNITVIISNKDRDGLKESTSEWFLKELFRSFKNVHIIPAVGSSPVVTALNMTSMKEFGDGIYSMVSSGKDYDIKRTLVYYDMFKKGGKYYTPGVTPEILNLADTPVMYAERGDDYDETPISGVIIRQDIVNKDYDRFRAAYVDIINDGFVDESIIKEYFEKLCQEINRDDSVNESISRHINHPYEYDDMTFGEIKDLITHLLSGSVTEITEKIDGVNIYASVDDLGRTIFARNKLQLRTSPLTMDDIDKISASDTTSMYSALSGGLKTIDAVIHNIPDTVRFFNYDDGLDGLKYRTWVNVDIVSRDNTNVIPYAESFVSFHSFITTCYKKSDESWDDFVPTDVNMLMTVIGSAISKMNKMEFKAGVTPRIAIEKIFDMGEIASRYKNEIDKLVTDAGMTDESTIYDYKKYCLTDKLHKKFANKMTGGLDDGWIDYGIPRLIKGNKSGIKLSDMKHSFTNKSFIRFKEYEKTDFKADMQHIMRPLDKLFISLGNAIIKAGNGFKNQNIKDDTITKIKKSISSVIDRISKSNDKELMDKLEYLLVRLGDDNINPTEGVVINYNGRIFKLTGSFAPINQILHLDKDRKPLAIQSKTSDK